MRSVFNAADQQHIPIERLPVMRKYYSEKRKAMSRDAEPAITLLSICRQKNYLSYNTLKPAARPVADIIYFATIIFKVFSFPLKTILYKYIPDSISERSRVIL